jgi:hypothetical protein
LNARGAIDARRIVVGVLPRSELGGEALEWDERLAIELVGTGLPRIKRCVCLSDAGINGRGFVFRRLVGCVRRK